MAIVGDAHVHIYPSYSLPLALAAAEENLLRHYATLCRSHSELTTPPSMLFLILTEREDCNFFLELSQRQLSLPNGYSIIEGSEQGTIKLTTPKGNTLLIIAGRQIATSERLELLSIGSDARIPDRLPVEDGLRRLRTMGIPAVLNWAPGKWLFKRRPLVEAIIDAATPGSLLLCDTTLRPGLWAEPTLMRRAREKGIAILRGSDPLPIAEEEQRLGSYGIALELNLPHGKELTTLRNFLRQPHPQLYSVGSRNSTVTALRRVYTHMKKGT